MVATAMMNHAMTAMVCRSRLCACVLFTLFNLSMAATQAPAQDLVRVHITGNSPSSMPFQIAEDEGFYAREGLKVRQLILKTGAGIQAMLGGDIDVSQATGPTVLAAFLQGAPLRVVMVFNDKPTYRLYVKKEIRSFADLKGAKIGSSTPGSTSDRLLKNVLERNGVHWQKDALIIYIGTTDVVLKAIRAGAIDAAVITPPANFLARDAGFRELFSFENEAGALQGGVTATEAFVTKKAETARRFLRATLSGLKVFKSDRERALKSMMKAMSVSRDLAERTYEGNVSAFVANGLISEDYQEKVLDFELKTIGTEKKVQRERFFDFSIMKSLAANK
jgi:NitT/TauT family transport system substrate-binding protein